MKNPPPTHISSFRKTLDSGRKVIVFMRSEQAETGIVHSSVNSVEDATSGEDITSQFSPKQLGNLVFYKLAFPTCP